MAKDDYTSKGYVGRDIPLEKHDMTRKKDTTIDLYMKDGYPCGDIGDVEAVNEIKHNSGAGNIVGGEPMGIHHKFANGVPNAGREDISAEVMRPEHKANVKMSVFTSIGDDKTDTHAADASEIKPVNMGVHNTFGVK